jgi:Protein of unknown function DUF84
MGFPSGAQYAVALEGVLERCSFGSFLYGWAAIREAATRRVSIGCSGKVMVPDGLLIAFEKKHNLSAWIAARYPNADADAVRELGSNGIITEQRYTRVDEFDTALRCALGFLLNEQNFLDHYASPAELAVGRPCPPHLDSMLIDFHHTRDPKQSRRSPADNGERQVFEQLLQGELL